MPKQTRRGRPSAASQAAKLLSALGSSKGGKARAAVLTPEERETIARNAGTIGGKRSAEALSPTARRKRARAAAMARWNRE